MIFVAGQTLAKQRGLEWRDQDKMEVKRSTWLFIYAGYDLLCLEESSKMRTSEHEQSHIPDNVWKQNETESRCPMSVVHQRIK